VCQGECILLWGDKTYVMGILNTTPDSFSGDGIGLNVSHAVEKGVEFVKEGANILDVGGMSTRPASMYGSVDVVSEEEEISRVLPVIKLLVSEVDVPISIDTYRSSVASIALSEGATIVNDIWGFKKDPLMSSIVAEAGAHIVLMHNTDDPEYDDVVSDVIADLGNTVAKAIRCGVDPSKIIIDPGIGFAKNSEQNLEIIRRLAEFKKLGHPILIGTSRKSTIGMVLDLPVDQRLEGTAATVALSIANGADVIRVHDVKEMSRVATMTDAIVRGWNH